VDVETKRANFCEGTFYNKTGRVERLLFVGLRIYEGGMLAIGDDNVTAVVGTSK
jgi:hypothetical protein